MKNPTSPTGSPWPLRSPLRWELLQKCHRHNSALFDVFGFLFISLISCSFVSFFTLVKNLMWSNFQQTKPVLRDCVQFWVFIILVLTAGSDWSHSRECFQDLAIPRHPVLWKPRGFVSCTSVFCQEYSDDLVFCRLFALGISTARLSSGYLIPDQMQIQSFEGNARSVTCAVFRVQNIPKPMKGLLG